MPFFNNNPPENDHCTALINTEKVKNVEAASF